MYSVNVTLMPLYEVKVVKGNPSIKPYGDQSQNDPGDATVTFFSDENFELHQILNGHVLGIVTPGGGR